MSKPLFDKMLYGGDYNPEQWPREVWDEDMRILKKAHINSATVNVFSWAKLQPSENVYDFSELDDMIDLLTQENYDIVIGTSTAALPGWLSLNYPDSKRVDFEGRRHRFGHRHNHCPNSPSFQLFAERLVSKIAERYGDHPNIKVWHISNEYGGECYCENCERAFRNWIKDKYKTIDAVNEAWNLNLWSHTLHSFEEIVVPNYLGVGISDTAAAYPGISIDYRRFNSEGLLNNFIMEREAIREYDKDSLVTTNFMGAYKPLDYFKWAKEMDIVSWDNYPGLHTTLSQTNFNNDLMRGMKDGQSFMLMEQTPSQQNWQPYNVLKRPGKMRAQSYQTIAHGADTIQYFQLRRSKGGAEKFHGGVIGHVGHEDTRVFKEVTQLGKELEKLGDRLIGAETKAKVGILFDWDNFWALEYTIGPSADLRYVDQIQHYYDACYEKQVAIDLLHMDSDFKKYDVVLAPVLYMVKEGVAEKIEAYVKQGGTFLTTYMSGIVDQSDNVHLGGYPGPLREIMGVWVEEIDALAPESYNVLQTDSDIFEKTEYKCTMLCDLMHTEGAEVIAQYGSDFYKGMPAVTKNNFGEGESWYVGSAIEQDMLNELIGSLLDHKGIKGYGPLPKGVEIASRVKEDNEYFFVMNHSEETQTIETEFAGYTDLLIDEKVEQQMTLKAFDVKILVKERASE